ncbi:uncharacterized protein PG986_006391 [Apiospora aurea]|uniref:Uncharacterized protein n=1 Tax=Apiospora aurea TaxID=335848 RepID=A0ABR1QKA2_9PEZI
MMCISNRSDNLGCQGIDGGGRLRAAGDPTGDDVKQKLAALSATDFLDLFGQLVEDRTIVYHCGFVIGPQGNLRTAQVSRDQALREESWHRHRSAPSYKTALDRIAAKKKMR